MTTPIQWGPNAGPEDSAQREQYVLQHARAIDAQQVNAQAIQRFGMSGIQGSDLIAQMTRITTLIDTLFGTLEGIPGLLDMGSSTFRLEFEQLCQGRIAETFGGVQAMIEQAQQASGQTHQRQSGIIVAGRNGKINGG